MAVDHMMPKCWPEAMAIGAWLAGVFLVFRVSAFRIDKPGHRGYFGLPYLWNLKFLSPGNFTPEGRGVLYWLWFDTAIFGLAAVLAVVLCV
jgi:hypothetical protein